MDISILNNRGLIPNKSNRVHNLFLTLITNLNVYISNQQLNNLREINLPR